VGLRTASWVFWEGGAAPHVDQVAHIALGILPAALSIAALN
jgi:hypothetical protein